MALQINKILKKGIVAPECYAKIIGVRYLKKQYPESTDGTVIVIAFYFNKSIRDIDELDFIDTEEYIIEDINTETREAQYIYFKTLDDFTGAIDV